MNRCVSIHLLETCERLFDPSRAKRRIGLEVEFFEPHVKRVADTISRHLKSSYVLEGNEYVFDLESMGSVRVKEESNRFADDRHDHTSGITEVVFPPLAFGQLGAVQDVLLALQAEGVQGTEGRHPVSIQVNLEIFPNVDINFCLELMRNFLHPAHRNQILRALRPAASRLPYLQNFSAGFIDRLFQKGGLRTWEDLLQDLVYRQTVNALGAADAFELSMEMTQSVLEKAAFPVLPQIHKTCAFNISSLLAHVFPQDPYLAKVVRERWSTPRPAVEMREWNNEFDVLSPARQALGLAQMTEDYGSFSHDDLVSELSQVARTTIASLRDAYFTRSEPVVIRYFLEEKDAVLPPRYDKFKDFYGDAIVTQLSYYSYGKFPLFIPGESVVFHRRPMHRFSILGKYNPGMINCNIAQALENKYTEVCFWQRYAPKAMPHTRLLSELMEARPAPSRAGCQNLQAKLQTLFPRGWVLKGVWDVGTESLGLIYHEVDLAAEVERFENSDFPEYRTRVLKELGNSDPDGIVHSLRKHVGFPGWRITQFFSNPRGVMAQERLAIAKEFRVEAVGGCVLRGDLTVDRFYYLIRENKPAPSPREVKERAENYAEELLRSLPKSLRCMPFAFDIVLCQDGSTRMIESNPGGNCGFLAEKIRSIQDFNGFLRRYPDLVRAGEVECDGLSAEEQMDYLAGLFRSFGICIETDYPNQVFGKDAIFDPEFTQVGDVGKNLMFSERSLSD